MHCNQCNHSPGLPGPGRCAVSSCPGQEVPMSRSMLLAVMMLGFAGVAAAQPAPPDNKPDATLRSTPETVVWGYFAADIPPALRIKSGQTVRVDTVSHGGVNTGVDPVTFFGRYGIAAADVLKDAIDIYEKVSRPRGASAHILTAPIYAEEPGPGARLEVPILPPTIACPTA